jgi:hypothetical protein
MGRTIYWTDPNDLDTLEPLLEATGAKNTPFEVQYRKAISLQGRPFAVYIDYLNSAPREATPVQDPFTFDMETDELIVFSDDPAIMVDALIEMALYMQGFSTLIGVEEDWKIALAIGGWKYLRASLRQTLGLPSATEKTWVFMLSPEATRDFNADSFSQVVMLAGCPNVEVLFPPDAHERLVEVYPQLSRVIQVIAEGISMDDHAEFNARLRRAVTLVEERLSPVRGDSATG